jgi:hypothetical protein
MRSHSYNKILFLTIKGEYFDQILLGVKKEEYRDINERYTRRLIGRSYNLVLLQNGYWLTSRQLYVVFLGVEVKEIFYPITGEFKKVYAIKLGPVVRTENLPMQ